MVKLFKEGHIKTRTKRIREEKRERETDRHTPKGREKRKQNEQI